MRKSVTRERLDRWGGRERAQLGWSGRVRKNASGTGVCRMEGCENCKDEGETELGVFIGTARGPWAGLSGRG